MNKRPALVLISLSLVSLVWWQMGADAERHQARPTTRSQPAATTTDAAIPNADSVAGSSSEIAPNAAENEWRKHPPLSPAATVIASRWEVDLQPECVAFREWTQRFVTRPTAASVAEGVTLAKARRDYLASVIESEPERVLAGAVPWRVRKDLPAEVVAWLETRVDGAGELWLLGATPIPGQALESKRWMEALIGSVSYRAFPTGPNRSRSRASAALHGVALENKLALTDSPVRDLEEGEPILGNRPLKAVCPVSGKTSDTSVGSAVESAMVVDAGEAYVKVCTSSHKGRLEGFVRTQEGHASPWLGEERNLAAGGGPTDSFLNTQPAVGWSTGTKRLLMIRIDFSDVPGTPINISSGSSPLTETSAVNLINRTGGVRDFYNQGSYGRTTISVGGVNTAGDSDDVTAVLRMPFPASYYAESGANTRMHADARAAATDAGYNLSNYQRVGVFFSWLGDLPGGSSINYGGLGNLEGPYFWINGYASMSIVTHELGHTYGLPHASRQRVNGFDPLASTGSWEEYGDTLDVMGDGSDIRSHFSMWAKAFLHWIDPEALKYVSASGTYRIGTFDHLAANPASTTLPLALRIARTAGTEYWIGHRGAFGGNNISATNGAYILWARSDGDNTRLIDCNNPADNVASNAPLVVGQSLVDSEQGITIRTMARGGSGSSEWLDVQVTFDAHLDLATPAPVADERNGPFNLLLLRSVSTSSSISGTWITTGVTATENVDFTRKTGPLKWDAGDASPALLSIPITNDTIEDDGETFTVSLTNLQGAFASTNPISIRIAQPGAIDTAFRNQSAQTLPSITSQVLAVRHDSQGRVLIGGWFDNFGSRRLHYIGRLNPDGTEDPSFAVTSINASGGPVRSIIEHADGSLFVGGGFQSTTSSPRLQKLTATGALADGFSIGTGPDGDVYALSLQPDGKLLVAGSFTSFNGVARNGIVRLNVDGTIDSTFANPSFAAMPLIYSLDLQSDGKVVIGGNFITNAAPPYQGGVARLNSNGSFDSGFDSGSGTAASALLTWGAVNSVRVLPSGKIAVGGAFTLFNGVERNRLAILSSSGALDTGAIPNFNGTVNALLPMPDGSLVVGGALTGTLPPSVALGRIARMLGDGSLDSSFDGRSQAVDGTVFALALNTESQRITAGGNGSSLYSTVGYSYLFRLLSGLAPVTPIITQQPSDVIADEDASFTLSVRTNAHQSWCQWFRNGVAVPGATSHVFSQIASRTDNGEWMARLTTLYGVLQTEPATVSVRYQPVITTQPLTTRVNLGASASLSVLAKGGDLSYQWQKGGQDLAGATSATLPLNNVQLSDASDYQCVVTNALGSATSAAANVTVVSAPTILAQPDDAIVLVGQSATLNVSGSGLFLTYQWLKNGTPISQATSSTFKLSKVSTSHAGAYTCLVTNSAGNAASNAAQLHVVVKPTLTIHPQAQLRPVTGSATLTVAATGEFVSYQWQKGTANIPGANAALLTLSPLSAADKASYRCVVSNLAGSVTSAAAGLTLYEAPVITSQPVALPAVPRGNASEFRVTATGMFVSYRWQRNQSDIPGAITNVLALPYPDAEHDGSYRCLVSNLAGGVFTNEVTLSVLQPPSITTQLVDASPSIGESVSFAVTATGSSLAYRWEFNGTAISGATTSTLTISSASNADAGEYRCIVTNAAGSATSRTARLAIGGLPLITLQPLNVSAEAGSSVTLSTAATGTGLTYQWQRNGTNLSATSTSITLTPFTTAHAGAYRCVVTNSASSVSTRTALVSVAGPLGASIDDASRKWQSLSLGNPWAKDTAVTRDRVDALKSGATLDGESCTLRTLVTGPVLVRFWRRVSSQAGSDFLRYTVDGIADPDVPDVSGEVDWQECLSLVPTGTHELAWTYQKDAAGFYGTDSAWIDQFSTGIPAYITTQPSNVLALAGSTAHFEVGVRTLGTTYQWRRNNKAISGATQPALDITASTAGDYSVLIGGKISSAVAKLCVVAPPIPSRVANNATATLALTLSGSNFVSFQWLKPDHTPLLDDARITGTATSKLTLGNITAPDEGSYACRVSAFSPPQMLDIEPCVVSIVTQPVVNATGPPPAIVSGLFGWQLSATQFPNGFTITGLPKGLKYDPISGYVSGIPEIDGTFPIQVVARNAPFVSFVKNYQLVIAALPEGALGSFSALIGRNTAFNANLGGRLEFTVAKTGTFTGKLWQGSTSYSLPGRVSAQPNGVIHLNTSYTPSGASLKSIAITFDVTQQTIAGTIDGVSLIDGARHVWGTAPPPTAFAGSFNCSHQVILAQQTNAALPQGTGYTQLSVSSLGSVTTTGKLPDGTALAHTGHLWPDGRAPMFLMLYSNQGSLTGTHLINSGLVTGTLTWLKQAGASPTSYPNGFPEIVTFDTDGAAWVKPASNQPVLGLSSARIRFVGGDIASAQMASSMEQVFSITGSSLAQFLPGANAAAETLSFNATTGLFTGGFTLIDAGNVKRTGEISGILLSHRSEGRGFFILRELVGTKVASGRVLISAP